MIDELIELFGGTVIFAKYPEILNGKDPGLKYPFVEGNYTSATIVSESLRFSPLAMLTQAVFMMPKQAPIEQIAYLEDLLQKKAQMIKFDNDCPNDYENAVAQLHDGTLHVLHPYDNFPKEKYVNDPDLLFYLNNKANLGKITNNHLPRALISVATLLEGKHPLLQKKYVVKKLTGAAGDGVNIGGDYGALDPQSSVIVEEYCDAVNNYGIQFLIADGKASLIEFNKQFTSDAGEFEGVPCCFDEEPEKKLYAVGHDAALKVASFGYKGIAGFDVLEDAGGNFFVIVPNIRPTASTPAYLINKSLSLGGYAYLGSGKITAKNPTAVIEKVASSGGILVSMSHGVPHDGHFTYNYFAMFPSKNPDDAYQSFQDYQVM